MSAEETDTQEQGSQADFDAFKEQVGGEFNDIKSQLAQSTESVRAIAEALIEQRRSEKDVQPEVADEDLTVAELEKRILKKATDLADQKVSQASQAQQAINNTLVALSQDYPEISNPSHAMNKKMVEIHSKLSAGLKDTPDGYRMAALQAAQETGTLPFSKRPQADQDSFSFGPQSGHQPSRQSQKSQELSSETIAVAKLMGLNTDDKKVVENLKSHAQRNFSKYR